ncbi:hypothetical protein TYRP_009390, partial [Tyrophagus putrescentiae]
MGSPQSNFILNNQKLSPPPQRQSSLSHCFRNSKRWLSIASQHATLLSQLCCGGASTHLNSTQGEEEEEEEESQSEFPSPS